MLATGQRLEKQACRADTNSRAQKLVNLDQHRPGNHKLPPQLTDERGREPVRPVTTIRRRDERPRVCNDPQRARTSSRR